MLFFAFSSILHLGLAFQNTSEIKKIITFMAGVIFTDPDEELFIRKQNMSSR